MFDTTTLVGVVGAGIILIFFLLNQSKVLNTESVWYDGGNMVGSALLALYAYLLSSEPFLVLNIVWFLFSFKDVVVYFTKRGA